MKNEEYEGLNWLRGISAILVLIHHARPFLFQNFQAMNSSGFIEKIFFITTGLGTSAVMVFFVLSGYLVGGSVIKSLDGNDWKWTNYMVARLSRLWTVLIPCLIITFILDYIGIHFLKSEFYTGGLYLNYFSGPKMGQGTHLDMATFLGNLLFLQGIFTEVLGTNGPLWSIAYEFWYYVLFPFLYISLSYKSAKSVYYILCFFIISIFVGKDILLLFPAWLIGVLAYKMRQSVLARIFDSSKYISLISIGSLIISLCIMRAASLHDTIAGKYFVAFVTFFALFAFKSKSLRFPHQFGKFLSNISFSLYLSHFPVLALIVSAMGLPKYDSIRSGFIPFISSVILCIFIGSLLYFIFETKTKLVRGSMMSLFSRSGP